MALYSYDLTIRFAFNLSGTLLIGAETQVCGF